MTREQIQGGRSFARVVGLTRCEAKVLWGYDCQLDGSEMHFDHLFPHSFGGPTVAGNRMTLCSLHNSAKGSDIHVFPWENQPNWLESHLELMARLIN